MENIMEEDKFAKCIFIYNALENGWTITKCNDNYIFRKKHEDKKEIFEESYLNTFIKSNTNIEKFLKK